MSRTLFAMMALSLLAGAPASAAAAAYPRAGWEAELSQVAHGVSGTVRIVDEFTLYVEDFNYDGTGLTVYFWLDDENWGGPDVDYDSGIAVSQNLIGPPFNGASLELDLGAISMDGHDGISVWCEDVAFSFGDGVFQAVPEPGTAVQNAATIATLLGLLRGRRRRC